MSRLDSMIRRFTAQRDTLNLAARLIKDIPGPVFELGLGNGRTYDHLREIMPDREIFAFDRKISANPRSIPDAKYMIVGEIRDTLEYCLPRTDGPAALIHVDMGDGDPTSALATRAWLTPLIAERIIPGGIIISDAELALSGFALLDPPEGVKPGRIFLYRAPL